MSSSEKGFYGWRLVGVGWVLYGFGTAPAFYSWGFFLPETIDDLGLTRGQAGLLFGLFALCGGLVSPLVALALGRFGLRRCYAFGCLMGSIGYFWTAHAQGMRDFLISFSLFTALGHSFATVLPTQTLATNWFLRYRARVLAVLMTSSGVVAPLVYAFDTRLLERSDWRHGWQLIALVVFLLGVFAWLFVRDTPESLGQLRDGAKSELEVHAALAALGDRERDEWSTAEALRTPHFFLLLLCGLGYALPYYVINAHGRLHMEDLGFPVGSVAVVLSVMAVVSIFGRLGGSLGDFMAPPRVLGLALVIEAVGSALFLVASTLTLAYAAVVAIGFGFGTAYIAQAATFSSFFGRKAFATTTGIRFSIGAVFAAGAPAAAGWAHDAIGSYAPAFLGLAAIGLAGAVVGLVIRPPRHRVVAAV